MKEEATLDEQVREIIQRIVNDKAHTDFHELMEAIDKLFEKRNENLERLIEIKVNERINDLVHKLNLGLVQQLNKMKNKEVT